MKESEFFDVEELFVGVAEDVKEHPKGGGDRIHLFSLAEEGVVPFDFGFDVGGSDRSFPSAV